MNYRFTNDWFEKSELKTIIHNYLSPDKVNVMLEIGAYEGQASVFLVNNFCNMDGSELVIVDPFDYNDKTTPVNFETLYNFIYNIDLCERGSKVKLIRDFSIHYYKTWAGYEPEFKKMYDFIYIDGSHLLHDVTIDFIFCNLMIKKGGIMWIDDFESSHEFKNQIMKLLVLYSNQYEIIHMGYQLGLRKI